jgi:AAA family ATP:ADP antiporter
MNSTAAEVTPASLRTDPGRVKALLAFGFFFFLIAGYYWIKPVREAVFLHRQGYEKLPIYHAVTAVASLALALGYSALTRVASRRLLLLACFGTFLVGTAAFAVLLARGTPGPAGAFYVALSLFNLLLVGLFWTVTNDVFGEAEGRRWYWLVGLAGPLGALGGAVGAERLAHVVGAANLLWISLPFMAAALALGLALDGAGRRHPPADPPRVAADGGGFDLALLFRSPYVLFMAGLVTAGIFVTTLYYLDYARLLREHVRGENEKAAWGARMMWMVNGLGILVQLFLTPVLLRRRGPGPALTVLPALMLAGGLALAQWETLAAATGLMVISGGLGYSLNQSAKELLYVPADRAIKYRAKALIDVFCFRLGDAAASLFVMGGLSLFPGT